MKSGMIALILAALLVAMLVPAFAETASNGVFAPTLIGTKTTIQWIAEKFLIPVLLLGGGTLLGAIVSHLVATAP